MLATVALTVTQFVASTPVKAATLPMPQSSTTVAASISSTSTAAIKTIHVQDTSCSLTYVVQSGDYLSAIGARFGKSWYTIAAANNIANPNLIFPGQHLLVCGNASAPQSKATYAPATANYTSTSVTGGASAGEPCHSNVYSTGNIWQWAIPPGCYSQVYYVNPANYVSRPGFGWCSWWPMVLHPNNPNILNGARHSSPILGAVIVFAPGEQGASAGGHYGNVVAIFNNGWMLISEMNDTWRGAGWQKVNYRYVHMSPGVSFIYG